MIDLRLRPGARPMLCGHRGGLRTAPENTLAALRQCRALGAGSAEIDIRLTADGALALMHDARLERTTDGAGLLEALSLDALRRLDAGAWFGPDWAGEPVPTLDEAIALARGIGLILRVEIKTAGCGEPLMAALGAALAQAGDAPPVTLCSFDHVQLGACRARWPHIATMGLFQLRSRAVGAVIAAADLQGLSVRPEWFDETMAAQAHAAGAAISCFFAIPQDPLSPDAEDARRIALLRDWIGRGVIDMITTDDIMTTRALLDL